METWIGKVEIGKTVRLLDTKSKRKYTIVSQLIPIYHIRTGKSSDYSDGKNFDIVMGTRVKDSSGRTREIVADWPCIKVS